MFGDKYVALNRHAKKMFKKKGIEYIDGKAVARLRELINFKKGVTNEKNEKVER